MKILVTGAGGFVGRKVGEYFGKTNDVAALTRSDLDITNAADVEKTVVRERPELIVNCAVLGVDECEADPEKAEAVNVTGPMNLAKSAASIQAAIAHFSTNYVFDGERDSGFYTIDDKAKPVNVYGRTKLEGEQAVVTACERSYIIRTSWVFGGSTRSFFDKAIGAMHRDEPIEAVTDNWASTTFVDDLVKRLDEIVQAGRYGTYHAANSGVCSKYGFAVEAARLIGRDSDKLVIPVRAGTSLSTKRPRYTPMACTLSEEIGLAKMRDWQEALAECIKGKSLISSRYGSW